MLPHFFDKDKKQKPCSHRNKVLHNEWGREGESFIDELHLKIFEAEKFKLFSEGFVKSVADKKSCADELGDRRSDACTGNSHSWKSKVSENQTPGEKSIHHRHQCGIQPVNFWHGNACIKSPERSGNHDKEDSEGSILQKFQTGAADGFFTDKHSKNES